MKLICSCAKRAQHKQHCLTLAILIAALIGSPLQAAPKIAIQAEAVALFDDNVTRAKGNDKTSDISIGVNANASFPIQISRKLRMRFRGTVQAQKFNRHGGLSRYSAIAQADLQYRPSGKFSAPTYGAFVRTAVDEYESHLRDGFRHSFGVDIHKRVTDRVNVFAAMSRTVRDGKSRVFDASDYGGRLIIDYANPWYPGVLYLGGEYRRGDITSTARPALEFVDIADAIVLDDIFDGRASYRFEANTILTTLGYSLPLSREHSLDFSWRWIESTSRSKATFAGAEKVRYVDNQVALAFLIRF